MAAAVSELSNKDAATKLGVAEGTVRTYWSRIFDKTGSRSERDVLARLFRFAAAATPFSGGLRNGSGP